MTRIDVRRSTNRFHTQLDWLDSRHSFSFGGHHDPANTSHGLLMVSNDDLVAPASGFGQHGHRDMEIVTWVLDGALEHRDSEGNHGVLRPGIAQRMSAGTGIRHAEMNANESEPVRFVQMWVVPDRPGHSPSYEQRDISADLDAGGLVTVVSGRGDADTISLNQPDAAMSIARLATDETVTLPDAPFVHLFVARGSAVLGGQAVSEGDAVRLTDAGPVALRATQAASDPTTEIIVWESHAQIPTTRR